MIDILVENFDAFSRYVQCFCDIKISTSISLHKKKITYCHSFFLNFVFFFQLGCAELKLTGNPFYTNGNELVETQRMTIDLLMKMFDIGWKLIASITLSQRINDKVGINE